MEVDAGKRERNQTPAATANPGGWRQADAISQDTKSGLLDALQNSAIHAAHDLGDGEGSTFPLAAVSRGEGGLGIEILRPLDFEFHELREFRLVSPVKQVFFTITETRKVFLGEVHTAAFGVVAQVAQNVRQLKCHAEIDCMVLRPGRGRAEDMKADQSHHGGDAVTIGDSWSKVA